jgi:hypothetical protein
MGSRLRQTDGGLSEGAPRLFKEGSDETDDPAACIAVKEYYEMFLDVRRRKLPAGLCQNCVRYPLKPRSNTVIYGDTLMHIVVADVVDGECVGAFRCESVRAGGFNFQACSFNH